MEEGELECSNQEMFSSSNIGDLPSSCSLDSFFDKILKDTHTCTHTHACNPPGPDTTHTHTCYHVHTKIVPSPSEVKTLSDDNAESVERKGKKRHSGNREAVRKYREKKKARAASLEDEVDRLMALNQQLLKRLQGQSVLEAEIARLKCLLVDIRGRIEGEIGSFPYQKPAKTGDVFQNLVNSSVGGAYAMNPCNMQCDDQVYCLHPRDDGRSAEGVVLNGTRGLNGCEFENLNCLGNKDASQKELPGCGLGNCVPEVALTNGNKRKVSLNLL